MTWDLGFWTWDFARWTMGRELWPLPLGPDGNLSVWLYMQVDLGVASGITKTILHPMNLPPLILASASPRRADLLRQMRLDFKIVASAVSEIHAEELTAREASQINAYRKARAVAKKQPDALVLGADTLVYLESRLLGKPANLEEAYEMLQFLQGKTHHVVTGICLLHLRGRRYKVFAETTAVTFKPLDAVAIRRYLTRVNPLDKAGAYAIQEEGDTIIDRIDGSCTNVVGLPIERVIAELTCWSSAPAPRAISA